MSNNSQTTYPALTEIDFSKYADGLVPAIIQDAITLKVLMLGFMDEDALTKTKEIGKVTFFSRTKQRLWTKGEESGNFLLVQDILLDCDNDTLLIKVTPVGAVCHTGADTCWGESNRSDDFLNRLEGIITQRKQNPDDASYTSSLFAKGINKIAQKVGEEAVEVVIESVRPASAEATALFKEEAADLLFHYLILLQAKGYMLKDITAVLAARHKA